MSPDTQKKIYSILQFVRNNKHSSLYKNIPKIKKGGLELMFNRIPRTTINNLQEYSKNLFHYPEKDIRYLVSEFDPNNLKSLFLLPQRVDYEWSLLKEEVEKKDPIVAILVVPTFWQMGPMFYRTCRKSKIPVSVLSHRNLPLTVQVIKEIKARLVVTTPDIAIGIQKMLSDEGYENQVKRWHLIVPVGPLPRIPWLSGEINIEFHIFPGIPVGYLPYKFLKEKINGFLPNPEYFFEIENSTCFITSLISHALPLIRLQISKKAKKNIHKGKEIITIYEPA
ncbi:MAG: hypothetical protein HYT93_00060 [Parcubacteria group bacterium]|nr:hypothetical protein [Parcubacteria group bacterium]